jgi:hypothetical protein
MPNSLRSTRRCGAGRTGRAWGRCTTSSGRVRRWRWGYGRGVRRNTRRYLASYPARRGISKSAPHRVTTSSTYSRRSGAGKHPAPTPVGSGQSALPGGTFPHPPGSRARWGSRRYDVHVMLGMTVITPATLGCANGHLRTGRRGTVGEGVTACTNLVHNRRQWQWICATRPSRSHRRHAQPGMTQKRLELPNCPVGRNLNLQQENSIPYTQVSLTHPILLPNPQVPKFVCPTCLL